MRRKVEEEFTGAVLKCIEDESLRPIGQFAKRYITELRPAEQKAFGGMLRQLLIILKQPEPREYGLVLEDFSHVIRVSRAFDPKPRSRIPLP